MSFSVLSTIESIPDLQELKVNSIRSREVKNLAERVKQLCHLEVNREKFAVFSAAFAEVISSILGSDETSHPAICRAKMWTTFHTVRENKLPAIWSSFLEGIGCVSGMDEPLYMELVNETYFENFIKHKICNLSSRSCHSTLPNES